MWRAALPFLLLAACATEPEQVHGPGWTGEQVTATGQEFTPEIASRRGVNGMVILQCVAVADLKVERCSVASEYPNGLGLGPAALRMVPLLRIPATVPVGQTVNVPVSFCVDRRKPCGLEQKVHDERAAARTP